MLAQLRTIFWIGIVLIFLPFMGIPDSWKKIVTIVIGTLLIWFTAKLRQSYKKLKFQLRRYEEPIATEPEIHG